MAIEVSMIDGNLTKLKVWDSKYGLFVRFTLPQPANTKIKGHTDPDPWYLSCFANDEIAEKIKDIEEGTYVIAKGNFECGWYEWNGKENLGKQVRITDIKVPAAADDADDDDDDEKLPF